MTHPYGKSWDAPKNTEVLIFPDRAEMTQGSFDALLNYAGSMPTGVYEGKMYRKDNYLHWWSSCEDPDKCKDNVRPIKIVDKIIRYSAAIQALWDASLEWEDQEAMIRLFGLQQRGLPDKKNYHLFRENDNYFIGKLHENRKDQFTLREVQEKFYFEFGDGIYPLEGVNAVKVWKDKWYLRLTEQKCTCKSQAEADYCDRECVKPTEQQDSEQKIMGRFAKRLDLRVIPAVEGTEVSEPTPCENDDCTMSGKCCYHECVAGLTINQEIPKVGGVSEEESNQSITERAEQYAQYATGNDFRPVKKDSLMDWKIRCASQGWIVGYAAAKKQ